MKNTNNRNLIFNYLYAMAIIMVIDDHAGVSVNLFNNVFPYNSFYMPLFVFSSGYFFKQKNLIEAITHKIKRLFIPYILYNLIFDFIALILDYILGTEWFVSFKIKNIAIMFLPGYTLSSVNSPAWFLYMLFLVQVIYIFIRQFVGFNKKNDIILLVVLLVSGLVSVQIAVMGYTQMGGIEGAVFILVTKVFFFLQFYHLGYMFNKYFENIVLKYRKIIICCFCIAVNAFLISLFGDKINYYGTNTMSYFHNAFLPIVTSVTGILFYYIIMNFLSDKIGGIKAVNFIARNTFVIMETHLLFFNIPNIFAFYQAKCGNDIFSDFDINSFVEGTGFRYNTTSRFVGFFCAIIGSLITAYIIEKIKKIRSEEV